jgi:transcriptional regulator with XRE-family HTH domain
MDLTKLPSDAEVGANLRLSRTAANMSQAALAERLTDDFGLRFTQQTIVKVEKGERSLKLSEAAAVCGVLGLSMGHLLAFEMSEAEVHLLQANKSMTRTWSQLVTAVFNFRHASRRLKQRIDEGGLSETAIGRNVDRDNLILMGMSIAEVVDAILDRDRAHELGLMAFKDDGRIDVKEPSDGE